MKNPQVGHPESFAPAAYTVIDNVQLNGAGYMLAHEVGHFMGANHDLVSSGSPGAYDFSHAHLDPTPSLDYPDGVRTIMGEAGSTCPLCERIRRWSTSDPAVTFRGRSLGAAAEDNATTLRNTAWTTANFRCHK